MMIIMFIIIIITIIYQLFYSCVHHRSHLITIIFFRSSGSSPRRRCAGFIDGKKPDIGTRVSGGGDSSATWGAGVLDRSTPRMVGWCYGRIWRVYIFQWFLFGDECQCVVLKTKTWVKMISDFWSVGIYWWYWMHVMIKLSLEWCKDLISLMAR